MTKGPITIIGIDIGFNATGLVAMAVRPDLEFGYKPMTWCCVRHKSSANKQHVYVADRDLQKLIKTRRDILDFCLGASDGPGYNAVALVVEAPTGGAKGARANRCMGMATGLIACVAGELLDARGMMAEWVQPGEIKRFFGTNSKIRIQEQVMEKWPNFNWPTTKAILEHVADAAAAALVVKSRNVYTLTAKLVERGD